MQKGNLEPFQGKKIKITLSSGYTYSGEIQELHDDCMIFIDKFGGSLLVKYSSIESVLNWTKHPTKNKLGAWP